MRHLDHGTVVSGPGQRVRPLNGAADGSDRSLGQQARMVPHRGDQPVQVGVGTR